ncbi:hypothetical protein ACFQY7_26170 [Actinomadura luteofluorescens]|uniref:hypothetical protein n=1 Tax=Actinomadura luteofluorescens TaxID=46163 RepID=UPI003634C3F2
MAVGRRRLRRDPAALAGLAIIALFVLLALAAPLLTALNGHGPNEFHPEKIDKALASAPRGRSAASTATSGSASSPAPAGTCSAAWSTAPGSPC